MPNLLPPLTLKVVIKTFKLKDAFTISRGSKSEAIVVTASVSDGAQEGHGECVPYIRYGETVAQVTEQIKAQKLLLSQGISRQMLHEKMPPGAARNALDCAIWDYEAKAADYRAWDHANLPIPKPVPTCYTISLNSPAEMEMAAAKAGNMPLLKVKLGGEGDVERIAAVRRGAPNARIVVDANESWRSENFAANSTACAQAKVELIEQPFPADQDYLLTDLRSPVQICADESAHTSKTLDELAERYQAVNIKLDKTGGLTEAIIMARAAQKLKLDIMVGCMVGSSLSMAPAMLLAPYARWIDLDGALLLAEDRPDHLVYVDGVIYPPSPSVWG